MQIKSNFRDYYDCIQAQDREKLPMYIRIPREERIPWPLAKVERLHANGYFYKIRHHIIGFCGTLYPYFELDVWQNNQIVSARCFTPEEIEIFVNAQNKNVIKSFYGKTSVYGGFNKQNLDLYCRNLSAVECDIFDKQKVPIFLLCNNIEFSYPGKNQFHTITYNAQLNI